MFSIFHVLHEIILHEIIKKKILLVILRCTSNWFIGILLEFYYQYSFVRPASQNGCIHNGRYSCIDLITNSFFFIETFQGYFKIFDRVFLRYNYKYEHSNKDKHKQRAFMSRNMQRFRKLSCNLSKSLLGWVHFGH